MLDLYVLLFLTVEFSVLWYFACEAETHDPNIVVLRIRTLMLDMDIDKARRQHGTSSGFQKQKVELRRQILEAEQT